MLMLQIEIHKTNILASEGKILYVSVNSVKRKLVTNFELFYEAEKKSPYFMQKFQRTSTPV